MLPDFIWIPVFLGNSGQPGLKVFLEKKAHIDPISNATNVDAQLKAASLLPDLVDQYIQALFLLFDIKHE